MDFDGKPITGVISPRNDLSILDTRFKDSDGRADKPGSKRRRSSAATEGEATGSGAGIRNGVSRRPSHEAEDSIGMSVVTGSVADPGDVQQRETYSEPRIRVVEAEEINAHDQPLLAAADAVGSAASGGAAKQQAGTPMLSGADAAAESPASGSSGVTSSSGGGGSSSLGSLDLPPNALPELVAAARAAAQLYRWICQNCTQANPTQPPTREMLEFAAAVHARREQQRRADGLRVAAARLRAQVAAASAAGYGEGEGEGSNGADGGFAGLGGYGVGAGVSGGAHAGSDDDADGEMAAASAYGAAFGAPGSGGAAAAALLEQAAALSARADELEAALPSVPHPPPSPPHSLLAAQVCGACEAPYCTASATVNDASVGRLITPIIAAAAPAIVAAGGSIATLPHAPAPDSPVSVQGTACPDRWLDAHQLLGHLQQPRGSSGSGRASGAGGGSGRAGASSGAAAGARTLAPAPAPAAAGAAVLDSGSGVQRATEDGQQPQAQSQAQQPHPQEEGRQHAHFSVNPALLRQTLKLTAPPASAAGAAHVAAHRSSSSRGSGSSGGAGCRCGAECARCTPAGASAAASAAGGAPAAAGAAPSQPYPLLPPPRPILVADVYTETRRDVATWRARMQQSEHAAAAGAAAGAAADVAAVGGGAVAGAAAGGAPGEAAASSAGGLFAVSGAGAAGVAAHGTAAYTTLAGSAGGTGGFALPPAALGYAHGDAGRASSGSGSSRAAGSGAAYEAAMAGSDHTLAAARRLLAKVAAEGLVPAAGGARAAAPVAAGTSGASSSSSSTTASAPAAAAGTALLTPVDTFVPAAFALGGPAPGFSDGPSGLAPTTAPAPAPPPPPPHASLEDELFAAYMARASISGAALDAVLADNGLQPGDAEDEDEDGAAAGREGRQQREQRTTDRGRARREPSSQRRRPAGALGRVGVDPAYAGPRVALGYDSFMLLHEEASRPRLQLHLPGVVLPRAPAIPHPERPDRLRAVAQHLVACGLWQRCARVPTRCCSRAELAGVHTAAYLDQLEGLEGLLKASGGELHFGTDTFVNAYTLKAAKIAAGATIAVTEDVVFGRADRGLALVRPPGHHAEADQAMGFCFYNNVAAAAWVATRLWGLQRVLVLDWDVHHGNGIENAFFDDPSVLYISLHRHDHGSFYPGTGHARRVGDGEGRGYNVNIPWSDVAAGDSEYMQAFNEVVMPIAAAYGPQLVFISAGFDAARGDPLGGCDVTPAGFAHMTHRLLCLAGGRCVVVLEGGYNLRAQAQGMEAVVRVLQGEAPAPLLPIPPTAHVSSRREAEAAAAAASAPAASGATAARAGAGGAAPAAARCCGHAHGLPSPVAGGASSSSFSSSSASASSVAGAPFPPTPLAPRPDPALLPRAHYGVTTAAEAAALAAETDGLSREQALGTAVPLPAATAVLCDVMRIQATFWPSLRSKYQRLLAHAIAQAAAAGSGGGAGVAAPFGLRGMAMSEEGEGSGGSEGEGGTASDSGSEAGSSDGRGSSAGDDTMQSAGDGGSSADHSLAEGIGEDTGALPSPPPVKRARTHE